ncbi:MAG: protein kinase domain-containing protein [Panacagrimonas sp.]
MNHPAKPGALVVEPAEDAVRWRFGKAFFDEATLELSVGGQKRELTRKPLQVLMFLLRNPGEVVTKDELFDAVWPGRIVTEGTLTTAIGRLRVALDDHDQQLIKPVYGYGYRFTGEPVCESPVRDKPVEPAPALGFKDGDPVPHRPGWMLRRRLGAGGGGEAWLAHHTETQDGRVFKFARDRSALVALKREITLSRLMRESLGERQDLVRVLDWNLEQAPFFIGLEYCNEGSLVEWADRQGGIHQVPMPQRLELLAKAADALAGPHRLGVLHKDLKPSNLLLHKDREGTLLLKLADFGSARLVDRRSLVAMGITQLGFTQTLAEPSSGTPLYLAPELLSGRPPTTRSDVYALGVMLYQLVVGELRRPLAPGWERDVEDPLLVEDIDAAAAGDPERRMADPSQLAERMRTLPARREIRDRQLADGRAFEAARLALERNRARRGLRIGLAVTLVAGLIVSAALFVRAQRASLEAQASAERANREAARANAVAAFLTDDILSAANPTLAGRRDVTMREVLDAAEPRLDQRFHDEPRVLATLKRVIGSAYAALSAREPAERLLGQAETALSELDGPAGAETQAARQALRDMYGNLLDMRAMLRTSTRMFEVEKAAGRSDSESARILQMEVDNIGCWFRYSSDYVARCVEVADQGLAKALSRSGPDSRHTLYAMMWAGMNRTRNGRHLEALPLLQACKDGLRKNFPEETIWLRVTDIWLSISRLFAGDARQTRDEMAKAMEHTLRIFGAGSRNYRLTRMWHARALLELGQTPEAVAELEAVHALSLADPAERDLDNVQTVHHLAIALQRSKQPRAAAEALEDGLARVSKAEQPSGYWTLTLREQLADVAIGQKDLPGAERLLRQNLDEAREVFKQGEWLLGWCAYRLGAHLADDGRLTEALSLLKEAVPILEASLGADEQRSREARERMAAVAGR